MDMMDYVLKTKPGQRPGSEGILLIIAISR